MAAKKKVKKAAAKKAASKKSTPRKAAKKIAAKSAKDKKTATKKAKPAKKTASRPTSRKKTSAKPVASKTRQAVPAATKSAKVSLKNLQSFLTPLDDRIVVRLAGADKMTAGGLYIPDTVSDVSGNLRGHVVAVGRGHRDDKGRVRPMDVVLGDQVIFAEFSGSKIKIQNEDFIILREAEVMGVVSK